MHFRTITACALGLLVSAGSALAEAAPPTFEGAPETYKMIFDSDKFRVISATWKAGTTDKPHGHPLAFVVYPLDDCTIRVHNPDGSTRDVVSKAGVPTPGP